MSDITVITCAIPERLHMLAEACASVRAQTLAPRAHVIRVDYDRIGTAANLNAAAECVDTEWMAVLADDDLLDPSHLATLRSGAVGTDVDVVYSWCRVIGRPGWNPNELFSVERLRRYNFIPATALIRTAAFRAAGGWPDEYCEDYGLWLRILDAGGRFVCVPTVTWTYRFHATNKTYAVEVSA